MAKSAVFLKTTGEALSAGNPGSRGFNEAGIRDTALRLAEAYEFARKSGMGLTLVSGGGNIVRGRDFAGMQGIIDPIGRLATVMNASILAQCLDGLGVPVEPMLPPSMRVADTLDGLAFGEYSPAAVHRAHDAGKVVMIGGGTGESGSSTDCAVVTVAGKHVEAAKGKGGVDVTVLKAGATNGVYTSDPNLGGNPRMYRTLSAQEMQARYDQLGAVDEASLQRLVDYDLSLLIHGAEHPLPDVLEACPPDPLTNNIGTLIVPYIVEPVYY